MLSALLLPSAMLLPHHHHPATHGPAIGLRSNSMRALPLRRAGRQCAMPLRPAAASLTAQRRCATVRAGLYQQGVAGVVAYTCVSAVWYAVGVTLCLFGLPRAAAAAAAVVTPRQLLRQAAGRVARAYAITFAASQLSAPWRAATAAALLPVVARALGVMRAKLGLGAASLLPAALLFLAAAAAFGAVMAALVGREMALLRAQPSEPSAVSGS
jgi:hypothetical protein